MVPTYGLAHIELAVADPERSLQFYMSAFGVREYFRDEDQIQVQGPGPHDVIAFVRAPERAGQVAGIGHFGFRLLSPGDIELAVQSVLAAGGRIVRRGEFAPGFPFVYAADPDGYEIEIWYE